MSKTKKGQGTRVAYDGVWKEIMEVFFESFIEQLLPELYPYIDFGSAPEFLDQEMQNIAKPIGNHKRIMDKLIKVRLKDGTEKWILIHVEVQSRFERWIAKRMFYLYSMISLKFDKEVVALVVYTTKKTPRFFDRYEQRAFHTNLLYEFNAYKVWEQNEAELIASDNPFALFVLANLYILQTKGADKGQQRRRLELKKKLYDLAFEKQIDLVVIEKLLIFVDYIMLLSVDLKAEFREFLKTVRKMPSTKIDWTENQKNVASDLTTILYGETLEEILADRAKERRELQLKQRELEKERVEREKESRVVVLKLHFENEWTAVQIAGVLDKGVEEIERVIAEEHERLKEG